MQLVTPSMLIVSLESRAETAKTWYLEKGYMFNSIPYKHGLLWDLVVWLRQDKHFGELYQRGNYNILDTWYEGKENKTTDGRKDRRDKTQRKAKDLDKWCDGLVWPELCEMY